MPVSGGASRLGDALRRLDAEQIAVDDIGLRRPTLDDVFLSLTGHTAEADQTEPDGPDRHRRRRGGLRMSTLDPARDALVVAKRNLIKIKRVPDLLVFTTLSPIMFVLLFAYVFGGAIDSPAAAAPTASS